MKKRNQLVSALLTGLLIGGSATTAVSTTPFDASAQESKAAEAESGDEDDSAADDGEEQADDQSDDAAESEDSSQDTDTSADDAGETETSDEGGSEEDSSYESSSDDGGSDEESSYDSGSDEESSDEGGSDEGSSEESSLSESGSDESGQDGGSSEAGTQDESGSASSAESGSAESSSEGSAESGSTDSSSEGSAESGSTDSGSEGSAESGSTDSSAEGSTESGSEGSTESDGTESDQAGAVSDATNADAAISGNTAGTAGTDSTVSGTEAVSENGDTVGDADETKETDAAKKKKSKKKKASGSKAKANADKESGSTAKTKADSAKTGEAAASDKKESSDASGKAKKDTTAAGKTDKDTAAGTDSKTKDTAGKTTDAADQKKDAEDKAKKEAEDKAKKEADAKKQAEDIRASKVLSFRKRVFLERKNKALAKAAADKAAAAERAAEAARRYGYALSNRAFYSGSYFVTNAQKRLALNVGFTKVEKIPAMSSSQATVNIREMKSGDARVVGTLSDKDVCYIVADNSEDWVYVESGEVRGFVPREQLKTGLEVEKYVETAQDTALTTAEQVVDPLENTAFRYSLNTTKDVASILQALGTASVDRQAMISFAEQFLGGPYVWGGESLTNGCDCSGFTQQVYAQFGIALPRTSYEQAAVGVKIPKTEAVPGDLLFYARDGVVYHVLMYIGDGKAINASSSSTGIVISDVDYGKACWACRYISDSGASNLGVYADVTSTQASALQAVGQMASAGDTAAQNEIIEALAQASLKEWKTYGFCRSVIIAQAINESGWLGFGSSAAGIQATDNNILGMNEELNNSTWASPWNGKAATRLVPQYRGGEDVYNFESMRLYDDMESCMEDYAAFKVGLHPDLIGETDVRKVIAVGLAGYATNPNYQSDILKLIEKYDLTRFDREETAAIRPDAPADLTDEIDENVQNLTPAADTTELLTDDGTNPVSADPDEIIAAADENAATTTADSLEPEDAYTMPADSFAETDISSETDITSEEDGDVIDAVNDEEAEASSEIPSFFDEETESESDAQTAEDPEYNAEEETETEEEDAAEENGENGENVEESTEEDDTDEEVIEEIAETPEITESATETDAAGEELAAENSEAEGPDVEGSEEIADWSALLPQAPADGADEDSVPAEVEELRAELEDAAAELEDAAAEAEEPADTADTEAAVETVEEDTADIEETADAEAVAGVEETADAEEIAGVEETAETGELTDTEEAVEIEAVADEEAAQTEAGAEFAEVYDDGEALDDTATTTDLLVAGMTDQAGEPSEDTTQEVPADAAEVLSEAAEEVPADAAEVLPEAAEEVPAEVTETEAMLPETTGTVSEETVAVGPEENVEVAVEEGFETAADAEVSDGMVFSEDGADADLYADETGGDAEEAESGQTQIREIPVDQVTPETLVESTVYTEDELELIWAIVAQEDDTSYDGALAVISSVMNRADINYGGFGTTAYEQLTAESQYAYSADVEDPLYYQRRLGGNVPDFVKQAISDCLDSGIRNNSYTSFRDNGSKEGSVQIGANWYFYETASDAAEAISNMTDVIGDIAVEVTEEGTEIPADGVYTETADTAVEVPADNAYEEPADTAYEVPADAAGEIAADADSVVGAQDFVSAGSAAAGNEGDTLPDEDVSVPDEDAVLGVFDNPDAAENYGPGEINAVPDSDVY